MSIDDEGEIEDSYHIPFLGQLPYKVFEISVGESMGRPVEARAEVIHKPPLDSVHGISKCI